MEYHAGRGGLDSGGGLQYQACLLSSPPHALFRYAFIEGVRVSWWVRAQRGTSVGALHRSWVHAQSAIPVVTAGRHISLTAVASFFVVMLLIDGPLFQRASSVGVKTKHISTDLTVPVSPSPFMTGATGIYADHDAEGKPTLLNPLFSRVLQQYNTRQPITLPDFGCRGKCNFELVAPGWDIDCDSWHSTYRLASTYDWEQWDQSMADNVTYDGPPLSQTMFGTNVTYNFDAMDQWNMLQNYRTGSDISTDVLRSSGPWPFLKNTIMFSSMRKSTLGGNGTLTWRYCVLREAVQKYPVTVTNTTVAIHPRDLQQNLTVYKVMRSDESSAQEDWPCTLGGLWLSLSHGFAGKAEMEASGFWSTVRTNDSSPLVYIDVPNSTALNTLDVKWTDPTDDMISMIQELSLRTAIATTFHAPPPSQGTYSKAELTRLLTAEQSYIYSPNLTFVNRTLSQNVNVSMSYSETVYQSNRNWMAGALAIIGVAFCAILPIFGSWWHLGRTVSLSPVEVAKAFDAPLLRQADPNGTARDIVDEVGTLKILYGASASFDEDGPTRANKLSSNISVQEYETNVLPRRRLHFWTEGTVATPREGETFGTARHDEPVDYAQSSYSNSMYGNAI